MADAPENKPAITSGAEPVVRYALTRPIPGIDGDEVAELSFRAPTGGDITRGPDRSPVTKL